MDPKVLFFSMSWVIAAVPCSQPPIRSYLTAGRAPMNCLRAGTRQQQAIVRRTNQARKSLARRWQTALRGSTLSRTFTASLITLQQWDITNTLLLSSSTELISFTKWIVVMIRLSRHRGHGSLCHGFAMGQLTHYTAPCAVVSVMGRPVSSVHLYAAWTSLTLRTSSSHRRSARSLSSRHTGFACQLCFLALPPPRIL